jgi:hypothetical protein
MITSRDIIIYRGFEITRIEGSRVRNSLKYTRRADLFSRRGASSFVKYVEYSVVLGTWNYSTNKLKDVKDEIDLYIKSR